MTMTPARVEHVEREPGAIPGSQTPRWVWHFAIRNVTPIRHLQLKLHTVIRIPQSVMLL